MEFIDNIVPVGGSCVECPSTAAACHQLLPHTTCMMRGLNVEIQVIPSLCCSGLLSLHSAGIGGP
jgi:hypothetical protein